MARWSNWSGCRVDSPCGSVKSNNRRGLIVLVQRIRKLYWRCYSIMLAKPTLRMSWISTASWTRGANLVVPSKKREIKTLKESQTSPTSEISKLPCRLSTFYQPISTPPCFRWPARVLQFEETWQTTAWQTFLLSKRKWTISSRQRVRVCPTAKDCLLMLKRCWRPQRTVCRGSGKMISNSVRMIPPLRIFKPRCVKQFLLCLSVALSQCNFFLESRLSSNFADGGRQE